jgi:hypothetical protein
MRLEEEHYRKFVDNKLKKIKTDSNINQSLKEIFLKYDSLNKQREFLFID